MVEAFGDLLVDLAQFGVLGPGRAQLLLQFLRYLGLSAGRLDEPVDRGFGFGNRLFQSGARQIDARTRGNAGFAQVLQSLDMCQAVCNAE